MDSNDKIALLTTLYENLYEALQTLRSQITRITSLVVGAFLLASGWFVTEDPTLTVAQKVALVVTMVVVASNAIWAVCSRFREFKEAARLIGRVEQAMGLFESGTFLPGEPLYPEGFKAFGSKDYPLHRDTLWSHVVAILAFFILSMAIVVFELTPAS